MGPDHGPAAVAYAGFETAFGSRPERLYRAPGRVNLIGEHTDYNDGFVLPMAIDRAVWLAASPRADQRVRVLAATLERQDEFVLGGLAPSPDAHWANYVRGVLAVIEQAGYRVTGMDLSYAGDVPIGAGLSSSAAVEMAVAVAVRDMSGLHLSPLDLARFGQRAEQVFTGTQVGLMDQLISAIGEEGRAMLIDCRTFTWEAVPLPAGVAVVVCDTSKRRGLVDSAYNERRAQCEEGAARLGVPALRDVDVETFEAREKELPSLLRRRCRHVVYENDRTLRAAAALRAGDVQTVGRLMNESHTSLRDLYEVSSEELDVMAALAQSQPGCWGARMTGAGFGGCVVALVEEPAVPDFGHAVTTLYERQTFRTPALYVCHASTGAERV